MRGWIEPRGSRFKARLRHTDGTNGPSRTFDKKGDARKWLNAALTDAAKGTFIDERLGDRTVEVYGAEWFRSQVHYESTSRRAVSQQLRNWIIPAFGKRSLRAVTRPEVRSWVTKMTEDGCAPRSIAHRYWVLSRIFEDAVDSGFIATTPCRSIKTPPVPDDELCIITPTELEALADAITERYTGAVLLAGMCGLRSGELFGLQGRRLDLLRGSVNVVEQLQRDEEGRLALRAVKSAAGVRTIPVPDSALKVLRAHVDTHSIGPDDLVFANSRGKPTSRENFQTSHFGPAKLAAKIVEPFRVHDLRHTAISMWIKAGLNPKEVQVLAGHSSIKVTFDVYGHLFPDDDADARRRMNEAFSTEDEDDNDDGVVIPMR